MSRPIIREHNLETGEVLDREMNDAEFEAYENELAELASKAQAEAQALAKKAATIAKLEALGLDAEDIKALGL